MLSVFLLFWWLGAALCLLNPVTEYEFLQSECLANSFNDYSQNKSVGRLIKTIEQSSCLDSIGIGGFQVESVGNLTRLYSKLNDNAMSFELWVQPQLVNDNNYVAGYGVTSSTSLQCRFNMLISQGFFEPSTNTTEFILQLCFNGAATGNVLTTGPLNISIVNGEASLLHLLFSLQFTSVTFGQLVSCQAYVNGISAPSTGFFSSSTFLPSLWTKENRAIFNPSTSGYRQSDIWDGRIYSFAMYDELLTQSQIWNLYRFGVANSIPVVRSQLVTVQQNGEVGDHTDDPQFYQEPIHSSDLQTISLSCFDFDDQPASILYNSSTSPSMRVLISHWPLNGSGILYFLNGTEIEQRSSPVQVPYDASTHSYSVRFRPPFNVISENGEIIANFSFVAVDGITGLFSEVAWVFVNVSHVDRPPIALETITRDIAAEHLTTIALRGSDEDSAIVAATIVDCPFNGSIYEFSSGDSVAWNCSDSTSVMAMSFPITLGYLYTGPQSIAMPNSTVVGADRFTFALIDAEGRRSVPALYTIFASTSLLALSSPSSWIQPSAMQETEANITVRGSDCADNPRRLLVRIVRTPVNGRLVSPLGTTLRVGDSLSGAMSISNYDVGLHANYIGNKFFFNIPSVAWNGTTLSSTLDSFDFIVYSESGAESTPATQYVSVLNVNDPTDLGYKRNADGYISVYQYGLSPSSDSNPTVTVLSGFSLLEFDKNVDVIRAHVCTTNGGELSLNDLYLSEVDFTSNSYCFASGAINCVGDGTRNSRMIFVGTPSSIELVLNGMTYQNKNPTVDFVNVTVYDGVGDDCFLPSQPNSGSIFNGCYTSSVSIEVRVLPSQVDSQSTSSSSISFRMYYIAFGLLLTVLVAICRCCWLRSRRSANESHAKDKSADNRESSATSESRRADPTPRSSRELDSATWTMHINKHGRVYYYNSISKESTWTKPECFSVCTL